MCTECNLAFFMSPVKSGIVVFSFIVAIAAFVMFRRLKALDTRKRLALLYVHVFAFVFPFLFFAFFRGCQSYFSGCDQARAITTLLVLTGLVTTIIALAAAPLVFVRRLTGKARVDNGRWSRFVQRHYGLQKQPKLYILDTASPVAFSFSIFTPRIFLSAGLFDILGGKEVEAVLLHEIAHLRSRASILKLSEHLARVLSPVSAISNFGGASSVSDEEKLADCYAASAQGTFRHLNSAKDKIIAFNGEMG